MKIVIAGAGKVGFELARSLSFEHDVTVIDKNSEALDRLSGLIDIYPLVGDIENPRTYTALLDSNIDIFIAVTDSDEANILSTLLVGDAIKIEHKIIRLRNSYFEDSNFLASLENLEMVFPFRLAAETVRLLLQYPGANNVKHFSETNTKLISIQVDNPLHETKQVEQFENERLKIVGIERDKGFILPIADMTIEHGDRIYFLGDGELLESLYGQLDLHMPAKIGNCVVFGAGELGIEVARVLVEEGVHVKILEKDIDRCHMASDLFQDKALVINSRYDETILYREEKLDQADMIITTDNKDETNIIRALQALEYNVPKVVAVNNERKFYPLMHQLGMVVARGPQTSAYYAILESIERHEAVEIRHFSGGEGAVLARYIPTNSPLVGSKIKPWRDEGIVLLSRKDSLLLPEDISLEGDDLLFLIIFAEKEKRGLEWIRSL